MGRWRSEVVDLEAQRAGDALVVSSPSTGPDVASAATAVERKVAVGWCATSKRSIERR